MRIDRRLVALIAALVSAVVLPGCAASRGAQPVAGPAAPPIGRSAHALTSGGLARTYHVYRPASVTGQRAVPLVVMLHGGFGNGTQAEDSYGWDALADSEGFLVAYPDGLDRAWAVGGGCCGEPGRDGVDDVGFVTALVRTLGATIPLDPARVYAAGISNGGMLAYRLACATRIFAAIGPDSATQLGDCPSPAPISVIHIHGAADPRIPPDGAPGIGVAVPHGGIPIPTLVANWAKVDRCAPSTTRTDGPVTTTSTSCPDGRAVELILIAGAGHQWPGSHAPGPVGRALGVDSPSTALDATTTMWQFFAAHPRPG